MKDDFGSPRFVRSVRWSRMNTAMRSSSIRRWALVPCVALMTLGLACLAPHSRAAVDRPRTGAAPAVAVAVANQEEVAAVEKLKGEAFDAARSGRFDRTTQLLDQAAAKSSDPSVARMLAWTSQFEKQRQEFATERHKS